MDLKKRFRSLKSNFLKRNDRTRNAKAIRNQLQQVELYEQKLQVGPALQVQPVLPEPPHVRLLAGAPGASAGAPEVRGQPGV